VSLRRESRRLHRAFGALLLALTPAAAAQACSDSSGTGTGVGPDATTDPLAPPGDAAGATDALDGGADSDGNLRVIDPCTVVAETLDAGPDAGPDADVGCRYTLPCGFPDSGSFVLRGCDFFLAPADPDASDGSLGCTIPPENGCTGGVYMPPTSGALTFECLECIGGGGRRPVGLRRRRPSPASDAISAYFARMAHDEAASVHAFVRMQDELSRFCAPSGLVRAAERAACDERRHARMMDRRARASATPAAVARVARATPRSLEAVARENAVEGCVHETFGALLLRWQASHAGDLSLRRLFARVAIDETRHAALSWEVARWAERHLDARARARVRGARSRALRTLRTKLERVDVAACAVLGQPRRADAIALLEGMIASLGLTA
jgi:rubrerythrin